MVNLINGNLILRQPLSAVAQSKSRGNRTSRLFGRGIKARKTALGKRPKSSGERLTPRSEHERDRLSITRNEIQPRRGSAGRPRPIFTRCRRILRTSFGSVITAKIRHLGRTPRTDQRVHFVNLGNEPVPGGATFLGRDRTWRFFRAGPHPLRILEPFDLPSGRGKARYMGHIRPLALCTGGIQSVASNILRSARGGYVASVRARIGLRKRSRLSL